MKIEDKQLVPYYLMSCFLYYHKNDQVLSDSDYNKVCDRLLENYDKIEHPHKHLVTIEDLKSQGSPSIEFPRIVMCSAIEWLGESKQEVLSIEDLFE